MKITKKTETFERKNSDKCIVTEYPSLAEDMDFAQVTISGRYPEALYAVNTRCKEMVYIHSGTGQVEVNGVIHPLDAGDVVLIDAGEKFCWDGNMTLFITCRSAFDVEQHCLVGQFISAYITKIRSK